MFVMVFTAYTSYHTVSQNKTVA